MTNYNSNQSSCVPILDKYFRNLHHNIGDCATDLATNRIHVGYYSHRLFHDGNGEEGETVMFLTLYANRVIRRN